LYVSDTILGVPVVSPSADPVNLSQSVVDWDKLQLQYKRDKKYHGVFRKYGPDKVRFSNDGAAILRYLANTQGVEAKGFLEVMKLNSTDQQYYSLGQWAMDFSTPYSSQQLYADIGLMDGGLSALLAAYESASVNIDLLDPATNAGYETVWLDGIIIEGSYDYQTQLSATTLMTIYGNGHMDAGASLGIAYVNQEGEYGVGAPTSSLAGVDVPGGTFTDAAIFQSVRDTTIYLSFPGMQIQYGAIPGNNRNMKLSLVIGVYSQPDWDPSHLLDRVVVWNNPEGWLTPGQSNAGFPSFYVIPPITFSDDFPPNTYLNLFFYAQLETVWDGFTSNAINIQYNDVAYPLLIKYAFRNPPTGCRSVTQGKLFDLLTTKMTDNGLYGGPYGSSSALLNTPRGLGDPEAYDLDPTQTYMTCGDAIRGLFGVGLGYLENPSINISMDDFFKDGFSGLCGGLGIEKDLTGRDQLVFEHLSHFYQADVLIANLGSEISDFAMTPYVDQMGNIINIGYTDQTYDSVNGKYVFNRQVQFKTPVVRIQNTLDYVSPIQCDPYVVEFERANLDSKTTTDALNDNTTFKLQSDGTTVDDTYNLLRGFTIDGGVPPEVVDSVFNISFSPMRNLLRLMPFLKANYSGLVDSLIQFVNSLQVIYLGSSLASGDISEDQADTDLNAFPDIDPLYKPWVFSFTCKVPVDLDTIMATNPYGVFGFTYLGYYFEAHVLEVGLTPGTDDTYNYKLLCSKNTTIPTNI